MFLCRRNQRKLEALSAGIFVAETNSSTKSRLWLLLICLFMRQFQNDEVS